MLRKFKVRLNDKEYLVELEELGVVENTVPAVASAVAPVAAPAPAPAAPVAQPAPAAAPVAPSAVDGTPITAPMPGTIWKVLVAVGDEVKADQPVVILEAMKMQNEIVAPADGKVVGVHVSENASVEAGEPMVTIA